MFLEVRFMPLPEWLFDILNDLSVPQNLLIMVGLFAVCFIWLKWKHSYKASLYYRETRRRYSQVAENQGFWRVLPKPRKPL